MAEQLLLLSPDHGVLQWNGECFLNDKLYIAFQETSIVSSTVFFFRVLSLLIILSLLFLLWKSFQSSFLVYCNTWGA